MTREVTLMAGDYTGSNQYEQPEIPSHVLIGVRLVELAGLATLMVGLELTAESLDASPTSIVL